MKTIISKKKQENKNNHNSKDCTTSYDNDQQEYDAERTKILEQRGLQVLRFPNTRIETDIETVLQEILTTAQSRILASNQTHPKTNE